ncbi:hypothetical protein ACIREO_23525 [Streptomyces sp. NPDC102441]|uniref:hypothetical protein n=1 Tax=Streptomyces sp. NPDC102441 TaxID=3366176 RepID=UPI0038019FD7
MIPANSNIKQTTREQIAKRYKVSGSTAASWQAEPAFPGPVDQGWGRTQLYDEAAVDEWVWEHRPEAWGKAHPKQIDKLSLPAGDPKDLMTLQRIGELEGRFLSREATPVATLGTYISQGILARPDRRAGDGDQPVVEQDMWFRETAYAYITRRRSIRRKTQKDDGGLREPSAFLTQYFKKHPGLLTLEKIAELDGKEHGREPTAMTTLKSYIAQGKLARPDRKPRDGKTPAVDERMWEPTSVLPFLCRPGSRRRTAQPTEGQTASVKPSAFLTQYFEEKPGLLTLKTIAELDGREQGRKPTAESTLKVYISQGKLARADRLPNDGKTPPVDEPMWTPAAALPFLATPRQASRGKSTAAPVEGELREPSAALQRYFKKKPGLLSLETIAELDGRELGRKPTALTTLKSYISQGRLARADRLPNDGKTPPVDEPMWTPAAALPYLLRPVGRSSAAAKKTATGGGLQDAGQ